MARLIAIEGIDGAGKNTLTTALVKELDGRGVSVARMGFPRYGKSAAADAVTLALSGQAGDAADSVYGMALLFALDRLSQREELLRLASRCEVLILDRYVASNAAYSAARLGEQEQAGDGTGVVEWIRALEYDRYELPKPDLQLHLGTSVDTAVQRAQQRESLDTSRTRDKYERDVDLQHRTDQAYRNLAAHRWGGRWITDAHLVDVQVLAERILQRT